MIKSLLDANDFDVFDRKQAQTYALLLSMNQDVIVPADQLEAKIGDIFEPALAQSFHIQVMIKRLRAMRPDLLFAPLTIVWCAMLADRVGVAVEWAYTMVDYQRRRGHPLTLHAWGNTAFPNGVPTEKEMKRIWDEQKVPEKQERRSFESDNLIDTLAAWRDFETV